MKEERAKEILEELGWQGINKSNPADICRECELSGNLNLAKAVEMLDRFDRLLQKEIHKSTELERKVRELGAENAELKNMIGDWQARDQMRISGYRTKEE